ncbi:MAG: flagellar hook-basal body complex protein FliE [Synergistaceae bacterium]|jgi:flagellar hook-basal body complex protein FliE|nr:flagellar hook-basal body complex protein FliE [Synergistaceae bacterium]
MIDSARVKPLNRSDDFDLSLKAMPTSRHDKDVSAQPFMDVLKQSVMKVNDAQLEADNLTNRLALGEVEDISEVSIAVEKAELALRLMVQIRDKLVDAYQQIARMSV